MTSIDLKMEGLFGKNDFERSFLWITFSVIFVRGKKVLFDGHFRQLSSLLTTCTEIFVAKSTISFELISNHYYLSQNHNIEMTFCLYFNKNLFLKLCFEGLVNLLWKLFRWFSLGCAMRYMLKENSKREWRLTEKTIQK